MKPDGARRSDEILRVIENTRSDMDHTLAQIQGRLTPGQLLDQGLDYARGTGAGEFVQNLGTSVKENPIPVALVGIGLAWLMASGAGRSSGASSSIESGASSLESGVESKMSDAKDTLSNAAQGVKERAGQVQQSISDAAHTAREQLARTAKGARHQLDRAREGYEWMLREQPLALGAIGVAVGALLAAAAPRTRTENELMGKERDELVDQATDAGREELEKARRAADEAAHGEEREAGGQPSQASSSPPPSPAPSQAAGQSSSASGS